MKNCRSFFAGFLVAVLILSIALPTVASSEKQANLVYNDIKITVNGERIIPKDANGKTIEPFIIDGTTYLPVRAVAEALNLDVSWDANTSTAILRGAEPVEMTWITRTGSKYHNDGHCNGGTYWMVPLSSALGMGLTPCGKCCK